MHKLLSLVLFYYCRKKKLPYYKTRSDARGGGIKGLLMRKNGPIFLYYHTHGNNECFVKRINCNKNGGYGFGFLRLSYYPFVRAAFNPAISERT